MGAQTVRLFDVFLLGPILFWSGRKTVDEGDNWRGGLLMLVGALTIIYNGANYMTRSGMGTRDTSGVNPWELSRGIEVEMEHTDDPFVAREIALDHLLKEDPRYYTKLTAAGL